MTNEIPIRICSQCNRKIHYKTMDSYRHSIKRHGTVFCIFCNRKKNSYWRGKRGGEIPWYGSKSSESTKQWLRQRFSGSNNPNYGKTMSGEQKEKIRNSQIGQKLSEQHKHHISVSTRGKNGYWYGKKRSEDTIDKIKQRIYDKLKLLGYVGRYNTVACEFINKWGKENGYDFRHALNGGEVTFKRYAVDGYDKNKGVIFEYDEPLHETIGRKKKDLVRLEKLVEVSNCRVLRYSEKYNRLYWSFPDRSEIFIKI